MGTDVNADLLRNSLQEANVDVTHLRSVGGPTGSAIILVQPSGDIGKTSLAPMYSNIQGCARPVSAPYVQQDVPSCLMLDSPYLQ